MLEIRRITKDEAIEADKVGVIAFNARHDFSKQEPPDPLDDPFDWTWAAFEDGRLVSKIVEIPYVMRFDGHDANMSGIGGVSTLPEARRGGKIRRIFEALLAEAYDNGVVFSCLAPFSHAYYRMFGYELCCMRRELRVPVAEFEKIKPGGSHELILPGGDTSELQRIHSAYISDINHAIRRDTLSDDAMWRDYISRDPYSKGSYIYLWRDGGGEPRGYIKYQHRRVDDASNMEVREIAFVDRESLYAQLGLAGMLSAQIKDFIWEMPMFIDPTDFVDIAWVAKQNLIPRDMTRIVNVRTALELMRRPEGEGAYVIETEDPQIPENSGRWLVEFDPAGSVVSPTTKEADLACGLPALAQLVTGYRTLDSLLFSSRLSLDVRGNEKLLRRVFTQRPQHVTEYF